MPFNRHCRAALLVNGLCTHRLSPTFTCSNTTQQHDLQGQFFYPPRFTMGRHSKVVHFVRSPVAMAVSGYLYHKTCREGWTVADTTQDMVPLRFAAPDMDARRLPYCKHLQRSSVEHGMEVEVNRSLRAADGIGQMLHDVATLHEMTQVISLDVLTVCIERLQESLATIDAFVQDHDVYGRAFRPLTFAQHMSAVKGEERTALTALAAKLLGRQLVESVPRETLNRAMRAGPDCLRTSLSSTV